MIRITGLFIIGFFLSAFAKEKPDTMSIDENDEVFISKNFVVIASNITKPGDSQMSFSAKIVRNKTSQNVLAVKRKTEYILKGRRPISFSFSDNGTMLMGTSIDEGPAFAQCIDRDGNVLWEHSYIPPALDVKIVSMILSPNGKYAIMTSADSLCILSGLTGKPVPSMLESKVKGDYTAFFDKNSNIVVVCSNWHVIKYDPESKTIIAEKYLKDPSNGNYKMDLNRREISKAFDIKTGYFAVTMNPTAYKPSDSANTCLLVINCDLNIVMFNDLHGVLSDGLMIAGSEVIMRAVSRKGDKWVPDIRVYTENQQEPTILPQDPRSIAIQHAIRHGDEVSFFGKGSKAFWKYNVKTKKLGKDMNDNAALLENDSLNIFKRR